jgi:hypothetical protein
MTEALCRSWPRRATGVELRRSENYHLARGLVLGLLSLFRKSFSCLRPLRFELSTQVIHLSSQQSLPTHFLAD